MTIAGGFRPRVVRQLLGFLRERHKPRPHNCAGIDREAAAAREDLSRRYLRGSGLELGALNMPVALFNGVRVSYVDRLPKGELLRHYPELAANADAIVEPNILDDGEELLTIADGSQDFVVANHFLEHCENPLQTMRNHVRVVRPSGCLFYAVPNSDNPSSWDHGRELTTFDHLVRDDREGPEVSRHQHYWEWVRFAGKRTDAQAIEAEVERLLALRYSIHFHVWSHRTFFGFLDRAIEYNQLPVAVQHFECNDYETVAILQVTG